MLVVKSLQKSFGEHAVLRGVSFALEKGELVGLVGPSGGGKSVLLKILGGVLAPDGGQIRFEPNGELLDDKLATRGEVRDGVEPGDFSVGFLFQEGALFDSMTVLENVLFPLQIEPDNRGVTKSGRVPDGVAREMAYDILEEVGLGAHVGKLPGQLSGGMRRRAALARALVNRPDLVLLDDPTGGLDPVAASVIVNLIKRLHTLYQPTMILVSHDIRRLLPSVTRVLALFEGAIVTDAAPHDLTQVGSEKVLRFLSTRFDFSAFG